MNTLQGVNESYADQEEGFSNGFTPTPPDHDFLLLKMSFEGFTIVLAPNLRNMHFQTQTRQSVFLFTF